MLTEQFVASIGELGKAPGTNVTKDAGIFLFESQPLVQQRGVFKKSITPPHCLAVSESHIFAAQAGKAVVHVYNRGKGNQEATVPFTERINCLCLSRDGAVLALGTAEGRILLWETCSGRQISNAQSHLQEVTGLSFNAASDSLLSASADSTARVWSVPALLSFSTSSAHSVTPMHTFTAHRSSIVALDIGHSSSFQNIAVTASVDKTCHVWDYYTGSLLRTFLLPATPTCLVLEPADRAAYLGYDDGSVQQLVLMGQAELENQGIMKTAQGPTQPGNDKRWSMLPADANGSVLSLAIGFDSTVMLSGHQSGAILAWDVATGHVRSLPIQPSIPGPVTNLLFMPVTGLYGQLSPNFRVDAVVKPKLASYHGTDSQVPGSYALDIKLMADIRWQDSSFDGALLSPSIPQGLLDEGLSELDAWSRNVPPPANGTSHNEAENFMAFDQQPEESLDAKLEQQNSELKQQLEALRRVQVVSFERIEQLYAEKKALLQRDQKRILRSRAVDADHEAGMSDTCNEETSSSEAST